MISPSITCLQSCQAHASDARVLNQLVSHGVSPLSATNSNLALRVVPVDSALPFPAVILPAPSSAPSPSVQVATATATAKSSSACCLEGAHRLSSARGRTSSRHGHIAARKMSGTPCGGNGISAYCTPMWEKRASARATRDAGASVAEASGLLVVGHRCGVPRAGARWSPLKERSV